MSAIHGVKEHRLFCRQLVNKKIFILIPALIQTGPVKGAIAFANAIAAKRKVTLVSFKPGAGACSPIDSNVECVDLSKEGGSNFLGWLKCYKQLLKSSGGRRKVISLSMCFSADMLNMLCRDSAIICTSIRSNLHINYRMDHGWVGFAAAYFHLINLRWFDHVVVMTESMAQHVQPFLPHAPMIVGNFIDEKNLEKYRLPRNGSGAPRFVFVGSLSTRKRPSLVIKAIKELHRRDILATLDVVGGGPLEETLHELVTEYGLEDFVTLHGQLSVPFSIVSKSDALVLPSLSEGVPRAVLESLYLGTPCVLRDVDGNEELIQSGINGVLFSDENKIADAMELIISFSRCGNKSLLPSGFRQSDESLRLLNILESPIGDP